MHPKTKGGYVEVGKVHYHIMLVSVVLCPYTPYEVKYTFHNFSSKYKSFICHL